MSRLIAFGCSHTFGVGLPDCYNRKKRISGKYPSKLAWPQILADKLELKCINLGEGGSSNKKILYRILSFDFKQDDTVLVLWSYPIRTCIIEDNIRDIMPGGSEAFDKMYYRHFFTERDNSFTDSVYKRLAYFYLNTRISVSKHLLVEAESNSLFNFAEKIYFDNYNKHGRAMDGMHHHEKDHELFALDILRILENEKNP